MKITDEITYLAESIDSLREEIQETNELLTRLANPPALRPIRHANRVLSIGLFMIVSPIGSIYGRLMN